MLELDDAKTASHLFAQHLLAHRTGLGADAAVVTAVKFMEMGLFIAIAGPGIQYNIPFHTGIPAAPFQRLRRARFNAFGTFTAQAFFNGLYRFKGRVSEYSAKTHPGTPGLS